MQTPIIPTHNHPELPRYTGTQFACFDGSGKFPASAINDDYCDCKDGSDEPGSSIHRVVCCIMTTHEVARSNSVSHRAFGGTPSPNLSDQPLSITSGNQAHPHATMACFSVRMRDTRPSIFRRTASATACATAATALTSLWVRCTSARARARVCVCVCVFTAAMASTSVLVGCDGRKGACQAEVQGAPSLNP